MPLILSSKNGSTIPVEVEGIVPETVRQLTLLEIARLPAWHGNQEISLGDMFDLSGDPSDNRMLWEGDLSNVHWLGAHMISGRLDVAGPIGRHAGSQMRGGEVHIAGAAGDWLGAEMRGGLIHVRGHAGHQVGAAYRGSACGMAGGTILVQGSAGNEIGHTQRRGLIAIGGAAGDLPGFNMLAGTILIFGPGGVRPGAGMRRGTLAFLGDQQPPLLPTFARACRGRPAFFELLRRELQRYRFPLPAVLATCQFDLFHGDLIERGRGEIWLKAAD